MPKIFGCVGHTLMIVVDLLLAFVMVHVHNASTQLASGRGLDQHGLRLLCHMLLLCSAMPSGYVCMYVCVYDKGALNPHRVVEGHLGLVTFLNQHDIFSTGCSRWCIHTSKCQKINLLSV